MRFFNCFPQLNNRCFCGFNKFLTPPLPFLPAPAFMPPIFNIGFNFNFNFNFGFNNFAFPNINNVWTQSMPMTFNAMPDLAMPKFTFTNTDTFTRTTPAPIQATYTPPINAGITVSSVNNCPNLNSLGYNPAKGQKLAKLALENANYRLTSDNRHINKSQRKPQGEFTQNCARYVKIALRDAGLDDYQTGHAYQMIDILKNNPNFKQIDPNRVDVNSLPTGCILVYGKGVAGYSPEYGHVEITTGNGKAVSDGITNHLRKPTAIFIPV